MVSKVVGTDTSLEKRWKGVRKRAWGRWVCEIRLPRSRQRIWLGSYATAEEAACAYDAASVCVRGRTASLNFPSSASISSLMSRDPMPPPPTREVIQSIAAAAAAKCRNSQGDDAGADRDCHLSAFKEGQQMAGNNAGSDTLPQYVRRPPLDWASAMALRLRLMEMKGRASARMHTGEAVQPQMEGVAEVPEAQGAGESESSSTAEEDQCLFSILKEIEPLPRICSAHGTPSC